MRILIVGLGSAGLRHAKNLIAMGETDLWGLDTDPAKMRAAFDLGFKSGWEMALGPQDAVLVCSPPKMHYDHVYTALCKNAHVFVEKPLGVTPDDWPKLLAYAAEKKLIVMVGYQLRFHKGLLNARHHWDEIGFPEMIEATYSQALPDWRRGMDYRQNYLMTLEGGIILEQSHEIDYCRWLAGEVEAVECQAENTGKYGLAGYDTAEITLYHRSGTKSLIHVDCMGERITPGFRTPHYRRDCHIQGTEGWIVWAYDGFFLIDNGERQIKRAAGAGFDMGARAYADEMRHFLRCCRGEAEPVCTGADGLAVVRICQAALESARCGTVVRV